LQKIFRNLIKIVDYFIFIKYFNKNTNIYIDNFDIKVVIKKELVKKNRIIILISKNFLY